MESLKATTGTVVDFRLAIIAKDFSLGVADGGGRAAAECVDGSVLEGEEQRERKAQRRQRSSVSFCVSCVYMGKVLGDESVL